MSNEQIEQEWMEMADQIGDEPCQVCEGEGCSRCEWSGEEVIAQIGRPPWEEDPDAPEVD
jgi:hypothetical protein